MYITFPSFHFNNENILICYINPQQKYLKTIKTSETKKVDQLKPSNHCVSKVNHKDNTR